MTAATDAAGPVLRDIHLPPPPGWWPPAPGWWLVGAAIAALLALAFLYLYRKVQRRRYRRRILREFEHSIDPARADPAALATALSHFLRRMTRRAHPDAAAMPGERWLQHLDTCIGSDEFTRGVGRVLIEAPYRPAAAYDSAALIALVRRCVRSLVESEVRHA